MTKQYLIQTKKGSRNFIIIDDCYKLLAKYYVGVDGRGYAKCCYNGEIIAMHKLILNNCIGNEQVDHINGNKLDNRLRNLRYVSPSLNTRNSKIRKTNTSGIKGVFYNKRDKSWIARGIRDNKLILDKSFSNKRDAVEARRLFDKKYNNDLKSGGRKPIKTRRPDRRDVVVTENELKCIV